MNDAFRVPSALALAFNEPALREFAAMTEAQKQAAAELAGFARERTTQYEF